MIGLSSVRARSSASSPHGYQSTGFAACWSRYGLVSFARRFMAREPVYAGVLRRDARQLQVPTIAGPWATPALLAEEGLVDLDGARPQDHDEQGGQDHEDHGEQELQRHLLGHLFGPLTPLLSKLLRLRAQHLGH